MYYGLKYLLGIEIHVSLGPELYGPIQTLEITLAVSSADSAECCFIYWCTCILWNLNYSKSVGSENLDFTTMEALLYGP
jgi:hypothetical protein